MDNKFIFEEDTPSYKISQISKSALTDVELLSLVIGNSNKYSGMELSRKILMRYEYNLDRVRIASVNELSSFAGIGNSIAKRIVAGLELSSRLFQERKIIRKLQIKQSSDMINILSRYFAGEIVEKFVCIYLNQSNKVLSIKEISMGTLVNTVVDPIIVFKYALAENAVGMILSHNHPSGNKNPSNRDIELTKNFKSAAGLFNITILDHIIYTDQEYYSFADQGML